MATFFNYVDWREPAQAADPWAMLVGRLTWQYGPERTAAILNGTDAKTNADLASWRKLGRLPPPPTPTTCLSLWQGAVQAGPPAQLSANEIIEGVAVKHGLSVKDLKGPSLIRKIAYARFEAMWTLRQQPAPQWKGGAHRYSLPQIGRMFGNRDHTTAMNGVKRWAQMMAETPA